MIEKTETEDRQHWTIRIRPGGWAEGQVEELTAADWRERTCHCISPWLLEKYNDMRHTLAGHDTITALVFDAACREYGTVVADNPLLDGVLIAMKVDRRAHQHWDRQVARIRELCMEALSLADNLQEKIRMREY